MNEPILEKIRKLLRLGQSSNPNEAALALSRAFELARKHAIDPETVNVDDEEIERLLLRIGARLSFERKLILNVVKRFFRVEIIACRPNVAFIGRRTDIALAHYVHDFLVRALRDSLRAFKGQMRRKSFIQGWIYGVAFKLKETSEQMAVEDSRFALVKLDEDPRVRAAADAFYPVTETAKIDLKRKNPSAMMEGWVTGKKVDIRKPLEGPSRPALQRGGAHEGS